MKILIVDDEAVSLLERFQQFLEKERHVVDREFGGANALEYLKENHGQLDLVFVDWNMPGMDGIELGQKLEELYPFVVKIMLTAYNEWEMVREAFTTGRYFDFVWKNNLRSEDNYNTVRPILARAEEMVKWYKNHRNLQNAFNELRNDYQKVKDEIAKFKFREAYYKRTFGESWAERVEQNKHIVEKFDPPIIAEAPKMMKVISDILDAGQTKTPVIITGETGTGKGNVAEAIHFLRTGKTRKELFVELNCGAIHESLFESEVFGVMPWAHSTADKHLKDGKSVRIPGKLEQANGGTLFLDEIGELPVTQQVKLLKVLERMELTPVGGVEPRDVVKLNFFLICATLKNLEEMVNEGKFRQDLFYRISQGKRIELPPLKERREDIPLLLETFIVLHSSNKSFILDKEAKELLIELPWKGNVRQLRFFTEHMCNFFQRKKDIIITKDDLMFALMEFDPKIFEVEIEQKQEKSADSIPVKNIKFSNTIVERNRKKLDNLDEAAKKCIEKHSEAQLKVIVDYLPLKVTSAAISVYYRDVNNREVTKWLLDTNPGKWKYARQIKTIANIVGKG